MHLYTAASNIGFGTFNSTRSPQQAAYPIMWKELVAVVVACATWGAKWSRKILFRCDNAAVVGIWKKRSCKSPEIMHLVCSLYFLAARGNYHFGSAHIAGTDNTTADHLSRFSMHCVPPLTTSVRTITQYHPPFLVFGQLLTACLWHFQKLALAPSTRRCQRY